MESYADPLKLAGREFSGEVVRVVFHSARLGFRQ